jgi:hypothetical protein
VVVEEEEEEEDEEDFSGLMNRLVLLPPIPSQPPSSNTLTACFLQHSCYDLNRTAATILTEQPAAANTS